VLKVFSLDILQTFEAILRYFCLSFSS